MSKAIETIGVSKSYGPGAPALSNASVAFEDGKLALLMGPSGSGKTTLLSIMGCLLRPTSGRVLIRGRDITELSEDTLPSVRLKHIGFIFQGFNLLRTLTALENIQLAFELKGMRSNGSRAAAQELLKRVGLSDRADHLPADLSGGQKQRVAVARALAGDPDIILADEPTAALDAESAQSVMSLLSDLSRRHGRAVVVVTHDHRLTSFADQVVRVSDGRLATQIHPSAEVAI